MSMNPFNGYWLIGSQVYSSARNGLFPLSDAAYIAWCASGRTASPASTVNAAISAAIRLQGLLDQSDVTMHRIVEAVALGTNSWTNTDVVAWVNYRRALRAIVDGTDTTSTSIPSKPAYPAGT